jgi:hypothetical protein
MDRVVETSEGTALDIHWIFTYEKISDILLTLGACNGRGTRTKSSWSKQLRI